MGYAQIAVTLAALTLGFAAGLLTFKRSLRWCRHCGRTLSCPACSGRDWVGRPVPPDARTVRR
jgi:hypothetical protein